jgi:hypothetical protein
LIHLPLYIFKYVFNAVRFVGIVDGATGRVYANDYPLKHDTPYRIIGWATALISLIIAAIPVNYDFLMLAFLEFTPLLWISGIWPKFFAQLDNHAHLPG